MNRVWMLLASALIAFVAAVAMLAYLWHTLGERGLYADATGTSGYTTGAEIVMGVTAVALFPLGVGLLILAALRYDGRKYAHHSAQG